MLLDDSLFKLWKEQKCTKEDVLAKAQSPDELAARIANAERGMFDDEDDGKQRTARTNDGRRHKHRADAVESRAISEQSSTHRRDHSMAMRRIGQILVDLGFITDDQLETLLEEQQQRPGELLGQDRREPWA